MSQPQFSLEQNLAVPEEQRITYFALTDSRNQKTPFGIKREDRTRHTYVIGKTGMGKSTLLENMAIQDIQNGEGLCFIDPHGGTAEKIARLYTRSIALKMCCTLLPTTFSTPFHSTFLRM